MNDVERHDSIACFFVSVSHVETEILILNAVNI